MAMTLDSILAALRSVEEPNSRKDIVSLGMVKDLKMDGDRVSLRLLVPPAAREIAEALGHAVRAVLQKSGGAKEVNLHVDAPPPKGHSGGHGGAAGKGHVAERHQIPGVKHVVAVSSGKGGVGKSTVAVNLACALAKAGLAVGLLDSDVYGPNVPTMMGAHDQPHARMDEARGELILPLEAYGVKVMSMGLLVKAEQALVWRGPMLHSTMNQFLLKVDWGQLDVLIVDMPPGTGDVQLSLTQLVPVAGAVLVTTPQEVALQDVRRAVGMFQKVEVPVMGIVENMSYFVCGKCDERHSIFGAGGGKRLAEQYGVPLLAEIPLSAAVREGGDAGAPIVVREPYSAQARAFVALADAVRRAL